MFIFYRTYDQRIQVAWGKRGWNASALRDLVGLKSQLVRESPARFREMIAQQFSEKTERQLLKVACDRLDTWHVPGMLFIGDAAHTMSPVAGQGINLAIRDSIVTANHMVRAREEGNRGTVRMCQAIEEERRPEVEAMQTFQVRLGHLMLGAPTLAAPAVLPLRAAFALGAGHPAAVRAPGPERRGGPSRRIPCTATSRRRLGVDVSLRFQPRAVRDPDFVAFNFDQSFSDQGAEGPIQHVGNRAQPVGHLTLRRPPPPGDNILAGVLDKQPRQPGRDRAQRQVLYQRK